jgi:hypothetical protein
MRISLFGSQAMLQGCSNPSTRVTVRKPRSAGTSPWVMYGCAGVWFAEIIISRFDKIKLKIDLIGDFLSEQSVGYFYSYNMIQGIISVNGDAD